MAIIHDLLEVTDIASHTTYSLTNGNLLGVVDNMSSAALDDGEFDAGDVVTIGGVAYTIDQIQEPASDGGFLMGDGSTATFGAGHESNLSVVFLTVSNGGDVRHFIVPNDSYGDINVQAITTGAIQDVAGHDAGIVSTTNNSVEVVCFAAGTLIETTRGVQKPVERLRVGDKVNTLDHGLQPIRWIAARRLSEAVLAANPNVRPIRIGAGALGPGHPVADLLLSPQHRVLVRSKIAARMFGEDEVLVPTRHLAALPRVGPDMGAGGVTYFHILLDRHEILFANGAPCESLYTGEGTMRALTKADRTELATILTPNMPPMACRRLVAGRLARKLAHRHRKNSRPLTAVADPAIDHPSPPHC
ncbi:hypothetical protein FIU94_00530 [Sulfitobacter sp. THAF37]|uniref:Hint domain-containing protein n=1 Tax=Sulfitobacter sp. THAF37 TaxID=2587855 RepID=UPI0012A8D51A|nr:Hint domain-containing protein [Sulfitobacter sp. THAF37]QFT57293.1 hypothetical protein FIU94_00530 [Sulfitobacter sp. THAF37]